jgi:hypothetical protein
MASYSLDRHKWTISIQEQCAIPIYRQIWNNCEIVEVDKIGLNDQRFKEFDFSGLDKIIRYIKDGSKLTVNLAQRFRPPRKEGGNIDFSFRYETPGLNGTKKAEYFALQTAFKEHTWYPEKYVFGKTRSNNPSDGFLEFYIYDTSRIIEAIITGRLHDVGIFPNGDGSKGIYYKLNDLIPYIWWRLPNGQMALGDFAQ